MTFNRTMNRCFASLNNPRRLTYFSTVLTIPAIQQDAVMTARDLNLPRLRPFENLKILKQTNWNTNSFLKQSFCS
jgi:hypothetical protein